MTLMEMNKLIHVHEVNENEIPRLRAEILAGVSKTYEELLEAERAYFLTEEEAAALLEVRSLNFLAGD